MKSQDLKSMILTNLTFRYTENLPETPIFLQKARSEKSKTILMQILTDSNYDINKFTSMITAQIKEYRGDRLDTKREVLSSEITNCIEQIELLRSEEYNPSYLRLFFDDYEPELENLMLRVKIGEIYQVLYKGKDMQKEYRALDMLEADLLQDEKIVMTFDIDLIDDLNYIDSRDLAQPYIEKNYSKSLEGFKVELRLHIYLSQEEKIRKLENSMNLAQEEYELLNNADKLYYELLEALDLKYMAGEYVSMIFIDKDQFKLYKFKGKTKDKDKDYCCQII